MSFYQLLATASVESTTQATSATGAAPADPISFQTALLVIIAGALIFLAKHIASLSNRLASIESGRISAKRPVGAPSASASGMISPEIIAAISAAIHTTLKGRHRVISVGQICPNRQAWSAEGRRQVFGSHKVR